MGGEIAIRARGVAAQVFAYAKDSHRATHNTICASSESMIRRFELLIGGSRLNAVESFATHGSATRLGLRQIGGAVHLSLPGVPRGAGKARTSVSRRGAYRPGGPRSARDRGSVTLGVAHSQSVRACRRAQSGSGDPCLGSNGLHV